MNAGSPGADASSPAPAPRVRLLTAVAAVSVGIALSFSSGHYNPRALAVMTAALGLALWALMADRRSAGSAVAAPSVPAGEGPWTTVLWVGVVGSLAIDLGIPPGDAPPSRWLIGFRPLLVVGLALAASYRVPALPPLLRRLRFPLWLLVAGMASVLVIANAPSPAIDVWQFERLGTGALLEGRNPYTVDFPNIYGAERGYYAKELLSSDGRSVPGYPYVPLSLYLFAPSVVLTGEVRWTLLACVLASAWGLRRIGRGTVTAELAAVFLLVQPRGFFLLEQSWTEPMILVSMVGTLLSLCAWRERAESNPGDQRSAAGPALATSILGAVLLAIKQYAALPTLPLLFALPERGRVRAILLAAGGAALLTAVPFALIDGQAFLHGVLLHHLKQPFREDTLSWPAGVFHWGGPELPSSLSFGAALLVLAVTLRPRLSPSAAVTAGAAALLGLELWNARQGFCNYYWLIASLLTVACALQARGDRAATPA